MTEIAAGIYCRISLSTIGDTTKTDDQERICRNIARDRGWQVVDVYSDESKSAWKRGVRRAEWERMLADVESGRINAVIAYHGDRLYRQPRDLEKLIDLAEVKGTKLASQLGDFDLGTSQGRMFARILAAHSESESARQSERRKSQYERWHLAGRVNTGGRGGRRFAFDTDGVTIIEAEAELLRQAGRRILDGQSTKTVAHWLNSQGAVTVSGRPFGPHALKRLLANWRYAGLMPDGVSKAIWEPILDPGDWEAVAAILDARAAQHPYVNNRVRYLLSGLAVCGECGQPLDAVMFKDGAATAYGCRKAGCFAVFRDRVLLDGYVSRAAVNRLNDERNPPGRLSGNPGAETQIRQLTEARADLAAKVEDPAQPYVDLLVGRLKRLDDRIATLREATAESARQRIVAAHQGMTWDQWQAAELGTQRALVTELFTVEVLRASKRGRGFNPDDVRLTAR